MPGFLRLFQASNCSFQYISSHLIGNKNHPCCLVISQISEVDHVCQHRIYTLDAFRIIIEYSGVDSYHRARQQLNNCFFQAGQRRCDECIFGLISCWCQRMILKPTSMYDICDGQRVIYMVATKGIASTPAFYFRAIQMKRMNQPLNFLIDKAHIPPKTGRANHRELIEVVQRSL